MSDDSRETTRPTGEDPAPEGDSADATRAMRTPRRTTLGPFQLEERIGEGGMGVVYRARDPQLRRLVALKRIHDRYERDENYCRRFLGEARAVAAVSHPNIAQIFSIHGSEGGEPPFFAMEYVEGHSADARVRRDGPLPIPLAIDIAIQAAQGLRAAQARGIIHRDVKPSNLLLDDGDRVKLVDFGLALQVGDITAPAEEDDEEILCTPHYVSPEQARGWWVDHRSDIYSLGCTLFFLLTGREPFQRENRVDLFVAHANEEIPRAGALRTEVPASLDALIARMLAKRPEDRPADYDELIALLAAIREEIAPTERASRSTRLARVAGVISVVAIVVAGAWQMRRGPAGEEFPVAQHFRGAYIAGEPWEQLHFDFTSDSAAARGGIVHHFLAPEDPTAYDSRAPDIVNRALLWSNYPDMVPLPYLSEFRELEIRGLRFLHPQDFRVAIGFDEARMNEDLLEVVLSVSGDVPNDRIVRCFRYGEEVPVETEPSRLDFRVKEEEYILRLVREPSEDAAWARFRFVLEQETTDGRIAEQANVRIRVPADCVRKGRVILQSQHPWPNRYQVSVKEILVRGTIDRDRLAAARAAGEI